MAVPLLQEQLPVVRKLGNLRLRLLTTGPYFMQLHSQATLRVVGTTAPLSVDVDQQRIEPMDKELLLSPGKRSIKVSRGRERSNVLAVDVGPEDTVIIEVCESRFRRIERLVDSAVWAILLVSLSCELMPLLVGSAILGILTIIVHFLPINRLNARNLKSTEGAFLSVVNQVGFTTAPAIAVFVDGRITGTSLGQTLIAPGIRRVHVGDGFGRSNVVSRKFVTGEDVTLRVTARNPARAALTVAGLTMLLILGLSTATILVQHRQNAVALGIVLGSWMLCAGLGALGSRAISLSLDEVSLSEVVGVEQDLEEPITCLQCGTSMTAGEPKCAKCGWTYID